jgi:hypothetical protein
MFFTDSLEEVAVHPAHNGSETIPAQNIHLVRLGYLLRESFDPNRCFCVPPLTQEMDTFSENCDSSLLSLCSIGRRHDEIIEEVQKSTWIRHSIDHNCREHVGYINRDESPLLISSIDIQTLRLQSWNQIVTV